jgi:hypothetical protein
MLNFLSASKIKSTASTSKKVLLISLFALAGMLETSYAANLTLSPSGGGYSVGQTLSVDVMVSGNTDSINAVSSSIEFSPETLELRSISKSGSIITVWAEDPSFSNANGTASLEGIILNPGFNGSQGKVVTLTFRVKRGGTGTVTLTNGSVLANDGNATNVLGTLGSARYSLSDAADSTDAAPAESGTSKSSSAPVITSSTHPDSTKWYNASEASFEWTVPASVTAVRTLYNETPVSTPNKIYEPAISNKTFSIDGDGPMYMHVQFKSGGVWGPIAHYKFQVDTIKPYGLKASFPDGNLTSNPTPAVLVTAQDDESGIDHITMSVDGGAPVSAPLNAQNLYRVPTSAPGSHTVIITALDKANNGITTSLDYTIQAIAPPAITEYTKNLETGGKFRVSGTTYPQSIVEVALTDTDGKVISESVTSDANGLFTLAWSKDLEKGVYEMRARTIDSKGAKSEYTDGKAVVVEHLALIRIGLFIMNWLSLALIIILASMLVVATFWYSFLQFTRFRRKIHRTLKEAEDTLKVNVQALRRDTEEFHTILVKAQKKRELTKEESAILKKFKKRLDITEKEIEKKLEQIG